MTGVVASPSPNCARWRNRACFSVLVFALVIPFLLYGGFALWLHSRAQPAPLRRTLFPGVHYSREVRRTPRPQVIHTIRVHLGTPGISFLVTEPDTSGSRPLRARTTSEFARENRCQVAINGGFFHPWWSRSIFDYYPHASDAVEPDGVAASRGVVYSDDPAKRRWPTLYLSKSGMATFMRPAVGIYNAISGDQMILRAGRPQPPRYHEADRPHPRTAVGLSRDRRTLFLVLVDGRQPGYSEGATTPEVAEFMRKHGAFDAMNLDGGGSSALVAKTEQGTIAVLNCPINNGIPGRERVVANHLGIYASDSAKRDDGK